MSLQTQKFLFVDCQTTGMRPTSGSLLELAWGLSAAASAAEDLGAVSGRLVQLPEGGWLPSRVSEITGIKQNMLSEAVGEPELLALFAAAASRELPVMVHYAQFERAFLEDLYARHGVSFPHTYFCTYRIARKLYPSAPSRNIRGLVGYLGFPFRDIKRAESHVRATMEVWSALASELEKQGVTTLESLQAWLEEKPKKVKGQAAPKYEYRVDRLKRLELPPRPGVYRMLSKSGDVLYVGKATSLKDRVNSYFRGKKGRDPRKLELMAQVWDLNVTVCGSPLEAALLETDEIKRLDPPYNVSLKTGRRQLHFYTRSFSRASSEQTPEFCLGPFRGSNSIEQLRQLLAAGSSGDFRGVLYETVDETLLEAAYRIFAERRLAHLPAPSLRQLIALGLTMLRKLEEETEEESVEELLAAEVEKDAELAAAEDEGAARAAEAEEAEAEELAEETPETVAERLDRVLLRAGLDYLKAKKLTRMLNVELRWQDGAEARSLRFRNGRMHSDEAPRCGEPWRNLDIQDYDRMSVLLSEVNKGHYELRRDCAPALFAGGTGEPTLTRLHEPRDRLPHPDLP